MKNTVLQHQLSQDVFTLLSQQRSLSLSTLTAQNSPHASYTPYAIIEQGLLIFISRLATHTQNLLVNSRCSVLIMEDEQQTSEIFARIRVSYDMLAQRIERDHPHWSSYTQVMQQRFGDIMLQLTQLSDFELFLLVPESGRYVKGFGRAYELLGGSLTSETIQPIGPDSLRSKTKQL